MRQNGWIRLHRSLLSHPLMNRLPAPWLRVWLTILLNANWQTAAWWEGSKEIEIKPGSLVTSIEKLASMSGSTPGEVRGALKYFKATGMATLFTTRRYSIISVTNWATYQKTEDIDDALNDTANDMPPGVNSPDTLDDTLDSTLGDTVNGVVKAPALMELAGHTTEGSTGSATCPTTRSATTIEEVKKIRKEHMSKSGDLDLFQLAAPKTKPRSRRREIDPEIHRWFEAEFWPPYPRHEAKAMTLQAAAKKATTPERRAFYVERLNAQLPEYNRRKAESGQRVIPLGSTWFNQDRAYDELPFQESSSRNGRPVPVETDYPEYLPLESRKTGNKISCQGPAPSAATRK